jgi:uncharacterized protein (DUF1684 family)
MPSTAEALQLSDWRRQVGELYAQVREGAGSVAAWTLWREHKERLYREHPQSPVPSARRAGHDFACFDHDPQLRVVAQLTPVDPVHVDGDDQVPGRTLVGMLRFTLSGSGCTLAAYWLDGYAGGLFVPFTDATSGSETYGGGRYILDTAKGADLGADGDGDGLVLDFNFAFAPSCAHDPRWRCPLAGADSRLPIAVRGGEIGP